jgi:hypothetical protein
MNPTLTFVPPSFLDDFLLKNPMNSPQWSPATRKPLPAESQSSLFQRYPPAALPAYFISALILVFMVSDLHAIMI